MQRTLARSCLQEFLVIEATPSGEGLWLSRSLMHEAALWPFEKVEVYNHDNGARFTTFVAGELPENQQRGVAFGGAAAVLARAKQRVTVVAYAALSEAELPQFRPRQLRA